MTLLLNAEFILYTLILWLGNIIWIYLIGSFFVNRLGPQSEAESTKEMHTLENLAIIGVGPFFIAWLLVTPGIFRDPSVPLSVSFISFAYWPETLLCLAVSLLLSYGIVRFLIKRKDDSNLEGEPARVNETHDIE